MNRSVNLIQYIFSRHLKTTLVALFSAFLFNAQARDIILMNKADTTPVAEREAILILPGFGTIFHNTKNQVANFKNQGFDVFIPDYISRKSLAKCTKNVDQFYKKHHLDRYKKVHVFSYIIGSWTINLWLKQHPSSNITTIVYDRSPLQESVPKILVKTNPFLSRLIFGKLIRELSETPYEPFAADSINVGILIECKATKILWSKKAEFDKMPPLSFEKDSLHQPCTDYFYTFLSHDDLYTNLETASPEVLNFFRNGLFTAAASREKCARDPFETYREQ